MLANWVCLIDEKRGKEGREEAAGPFFAKGRIDQPKLRLDHRANDQHSFTSYHHTLVFIQSPASALHDSQELWSLGSVIL